MFGSTPSSVIRLFVLDTGSKLARYSQIYFDRLFRR
jgi:hypothetical protein